MIRLGVITFVLLHLVISPVVADSDKPLLKYDPAGTKTWIPYYTGNTKNPGILGEIIPLILKNANIEGVVIDLPAKRTIVALENGELDFDVISPSWFDDRNVGDNFVLTHPIMQISENYIYLPETAFDPERVAKEPVGTIRGYFYHDEGKFNRTDFLSEKLLIVALHKKRIDYAISGDLTAKYWSNKLSVPIEIGPIHSKGLLHLRVRKEKLALIPSLNRAIESLAMSGEIDQLVQKYTRQILQKKNNDSREN